MKKFSISLAALAVCLSSCNLLTHVDPVTGKTVKGMDPAEKAKLEAEAVKAAQVAFQAVVNAGMNAFTSRFGIPVNNGK